MSTPKLHVKSGDTVVVISGDKRNSKGKTGKVQKAFPSEVSLRAILQRSS